VAARFLRHENAGAENARPENAEHEIDENKGPMPAP